jgi:ABC-type lipoprotein release transport system permease subunit
VAGLAIGAIAAFFANRVVEALVYGVRPRDTVSFVASALVLILVALMGAVVPARRAMRVDPVRVLRAD